MPLTLIIIHKDGKVLLGMKKRSFGEGRWNGFGGKLMEGESLETAAHRELLEEAGVTVPHLEEVGMLDFAFESDPMVLEVHVFRATDLIGEPVETEEMLPKWFAEGEIPFDQMWSDDQFWFPFFLAGKKFRGRFLFDRPSDATYSAQILTSELSEVSEL